jgi:hypothetical protein
MPAPKTYSALSLAVGGQIAKVLVELVKRHALGIRALEDRIGRGLLRWPLWGDHESTVSQSLLNYKGPLDVAAEFDVALLHSRNHRRDFSRQDG